MKYEMTIYWSEDDQSFVVEVPDLPGCMSDGATYAEAVRNAEEAMAVWLDVATELGREIPRPRQRAKTA
jgi:predicted RNase H-like HicB family nuclease